MTFVIRAALVTLAALVVAPRLLAQDEVGTEANQFRFERQLRVNPFDPAALNNLAVVKAGQGRYTDAFDLLERASRLAPQSKEIHANMGRLKAWMATMGTRDPLAEPELTISQMPPEPPPLWNNAPKR
jgi:Flp pilus assembly protein TadD